MFLWLVFEKAANLSCDASSINKSGILMKKLLTMGRERDIDRDRDWLKCCQKLK